MTPENNPLSFGTFEKQGPDLVKTTKLKNGLGNRCPFLFMSCKPEKRAMTYYLHGTSQLLFHYLQCTP